MGDYGPIIVTGIFGLITALLSAWFKHRLEKRGGFDIDYDLLWGIIGIIFLIIFLFGLGSLSYEIIETVFEKKPVFPKGILTNILVFAGSLFFSASYVFPCLFVAFGLWEEDDEFFWTMLVVCVVLNIFFIIIGQFVVESKVPSAKDLASLSITFFGIMIAMLALLIFGGIGIISLLFDDDDNIIEDGFRSLLTIILFLIYIPILSWLGEPLAISINQILLHYLWG